MTKIIRDLITYIYIFKFLSFRTFYLEKITNNTVIILFWIKTKLKQKHVSDEKI